MILERSKGPGRDPIMGLGGPLAQTTIKNNQQVDPNTTPIRGQQTVYNTAPREYHTLNDAILEAAKATATVGRDRRRVVYVISDGKEYGSKAKLNEVIRYLQTNKVSVYATLVGDASLPGMGFLDRIHLPLTMRDDVLPRYAAATGGQCDPEFRPRGIENSFADITKTVRTQYTIGYYSHEPILDSRYRAIDVRVLKPNLTVIAKPGYYPNASDSRPNQPAAPARTTPATTFAASPVSAAGLLPGALPANVVVALLAALSWGAGDFAGGMGVKVSGGGTSASLRVIASAHADKPVRVVRGLLPKRRVHSSRSADFLGAARRGHRWAFHYGFLCIAL